jgi:hypothetical protein
MRAPCSIAGCDSPALAKKLCSKHWKRVRKGLDPSAPSRFELTDSQRFWAKAKILGPNDCWLWTGGTQSNPPHLYGSAYCNGKKMSAHRAAWVLTNGPISDQSLCLLHSCDTPLCVNPSHLRLGTHQQNMDDKVARNRTNRNKPFCKRGHPRTPGNLYTSKKGLRACRECHKLREQKRRKQRRISGYREQRTFSF